MVLYENGIRRYGSYAYALGNADKLRLIATKLGSSIDLYLAYENAVEMLHPANADQWLIPESRKTGYTAWEMTFLPQGGTQWAWVHHDGLSEQLAETLVSMNEERFGDANINRYLVEVGNWSAIVQTSIAYAALAHQAPLGGACTGTCQTMKDWVGRGLQASLLDYPGSEIEDADNYHYDYTSDEGRMWAEGPYYLHYAAPTLLSFWHAIRVNQLNSRAGSPYAGGLPNPFLPSAWHLGPLRWLADAVTPQGQTPPLDDGNRHVMAGAYLLAWNGTYGENNDDLGARFAWISRKTNENLRTELIDGEEDLPDIAYALLSLAIPPATREQAPADTYGPTASDGAPADHLIVRNAFNYVLLNGEGRASMTSMTRGHGHEQADNMNLLWYVGRGSAIMDAGYDKGRASGSTWREYNFQNVLHLTAPRDCFGVRSWDLWYTNHSVVDPPNSWHAPVSDLSMETNGSVRVLRGTQTLNADVLGRVDGRPVLPANNCGLASALYRRDVLVVGDQEYLIDLNANLTSGDIDYSPPIGSTRRHVLQYYVGATSMTAPSSGMWSSGPLISNAAQRLHLYPLPVERPFRMTSSTPDVRAYLQSSRERTEQDMDVIKFWMQDPDNGRSFTTATVLSVSPSAPTYAPVRLPAMSGTHAAFAWRRPRPDGSTDVDLFVARSSGAIPGAEIRVNPAQAGGIDPAQPGGAFPSQWLALAPGQRYGFARINVPASGIGSTLTPGYTLSLTSATAPPLTATLHAATCAQVGVAATTSVSIFGGTPWYEVQFETKPVGTGGGGGEANLLPTDAPSLTLSLPTPGGTGGGGVGSNGVPIDQWSYAGGPQPSVSLTRSASYDIRARVTDRHGVSVLTPPARVYVQSSPCDDGTGTPPPAPDASVEGGARASRARPAVLTVEGLRPNPATSLATLTLGLPTGEPAVLVAYDLLGREMARQSIDGASGWAEARLDVAAWPSGLYVVRVMHGAAAQTVRLTVRR